MFRSKNQVEDLRYLPAVLCTVVLQVTPSSSCLTALQKMTTCAACQGLPHIKPCNGYCLNIMKGCLAYHYEINDSWNDYIGECTVH